MKLEAIVDQAIDQANGQLERLVHERLEVRIRTLVEDELQARAPDQSRQAVPAPATKPPCRICNERPRSPGRTVCEHCRHTRRESREPAADEEPPRPGDSPTA